MKISFRPLIGVIISKHLPEYSLPLGSLSFRPLIGVIISKLEIKRNHLYLMYSVSVPLSGLLFLNNK